jgi:hypothetical protein
LVAIQVAPLMAMVALEVAPLVERLAVALKAVQEDETFLG